MATPNGVSDGDEGAGGGGLTTEKGKSSKLWLPYIRVPTHTCHERATYSAFAARRMHPAKRL